MFGRNIDKRKIKVRVGVKHFLAHAFEKLYRNLVLYEIGGRARGFFNVDYKYVHGSVCYYLET
jgi:hypothetical protein